MKEEREEGYQGREIIKEGRKEGRGRKLPNKEDDQST
jgi:hypothetical protein